MMGTKTYPEASLETIYTSLLEKAKRVYREDCTSSIEYYEFFDTMYEVVFKDNNVSVIRSYSML